MWYSGPSLSWHSQQRPPTLLWPFLALLLSVSVFKATSLMWPKFLTIVMASMGTIIKLVSCLVVDIKYVELKIYRHILHVSKSVYTSSKSCYNTLCIWIMNVIVILVQNKWIIVHVVRTCMIWVDLAIAHSCTVFRLFGLN